MPDKKCKELVDGKLESRLEALRILYEKYEKGEEEEDSDYGRLEDFGLGFGYVDQDDEGESFFQWTISWGGPADEFRFFLNPSLKVYRIEYWYLDWFDGARRILTGKDKTLLMSIAEGFFTTDCFERAMKEAE